MTASETPKNRVEVWGAAECAAYLKAFRPQIGSYGLIWRLLQIRAKQTGFPPRKLYPMLRRFLRPEKPYFIGMLGNGVSFLGDHRDRYSVDHIALPDERDFQIELLQKMVGILPGAVLDIGANMGLVSAAIARRYADRTIFAFEPVQETAKRAAATFALSSLQNVRLLPVAVGERDEILTFYHAPGHSDYASANPTETHIGIGWTETKTPCVTLDTLRDSGVLPAVGIIKIDVEGHELSVLRGARNLILHDRPFIMLEYNYRIAPKMGWTAEDVARLLTGIAGASSYSFASLHHDGKPESFPPPASGHGIINVLCIPTEYAAEITQVIRLAGD
jgi:FkbM family methyltransferase